MRERTFTGRDLFPEGHYRFTCSESPDKKRTEKGKPYYVFYFEALVKGEKKKFTQPVMPWLAGDILRGLRCKEVAKDDFDWDRNEVMGRQIEADIVHEPDFKDRKTMRAKLANITPIIPETEIETDEPPEPAMAGTAVDGDDIPF